jgi:peptide/nickel transport system substrate-binding protein
MTAMPEHLLGPLHPKNNSSATYDDYNKQILFKTNGQVTLNGWMLKEFVPDERAVLVRNPYYWKVDTAGQQLPYFDRVEIYTAGDRPAVALGNVVGKYDHDHMWVGMPHLSMFLEEEANRDFHIGYSNTYGMKIMFNFDAEDPVARAVMRNTTVRRAIAMSINQPAINSALLFDTGKQIGAGWLPDSPYFNEKYAYSYSNYDLAGAKKMLDDANIIDRDNDGIRELPTGEKCELVWDNYAHDLYTPMSEAIAEDVEEAGIKLVLNMNHQTLHGERSQGGLYEMGQADYNFAVEPFLQASYWAPQLPGFPTWHKKAYDEGGFSPEMEEFFDLVRNGPMAPPEERLEMGRRAHQLMAENVFNIHVLLQKRPYITANRLGNMVKLSTRIQEYGNFDPPFRFYQVYEKYPQGGKP